MIKDLKIEITILMISLKKLKPAPEAYLLRYTGAVFFVIVALTITLTISLFLIPIASPLFLAAIFLSAWWGGMQPAIVATVLSGVLIDYFFVPPEYEISLSADDIIRFIIFFTEGFLFSWLITSRMQTSEEIQESREQLRSLSLYQQVLREQERKHIALEIHDELGQALTGLKMEVHFLGKDVDKVVKPTYADTYLERVNRIQKIINSTISTVRRIATELRPPIIDDLGLIAALEWQSKEFERSTGISCELQTNLEDLEISSEYAIAVFRIFQESLTNIMRHAEATFVKVTLNKKEKIIELCVKDNGRGIQKDELKNKTSLGLLGMKERARLINGEIKISSEEDAGTVILLTFPISDVNLFSNTNSV
jgi:signal transduction histidine kinase